MDTPIIPTPPITTAPPVTPVVEPHSSPEAVKMADWTRQDVASGKTLTRGRRENF